MVNEAKTEIIIRKIIEKNKKRFEEKNGSDTVIIEEKKSDNPRLNKLLSNASKRGSGAGLPEFIISFPDRTLVIVIECKGEPKHHRSKDLNKYADYAVDGALLYSSYISKEFDVIAIGASGQTESELLIDTFLQIRGEATARDLEIKNIYDFTDYFQTLKKDKIKEESDYIRLLEYSPILNQNLRDNFEFEETLRPLIVSGILLALEDDSFISSYHKKKNPIEIANLIITTIKERLEHDNIKGIKQDTIVQTYGFMKTNTKIINPKNKDGTPNTHLKNLIKEIADNVKPFLEDYKQYDVIGKFYNEFLRYANGDGGLGIVLTPKHITELFVDLAEVNSDSVILDNCCGTAGFLISAMKRMEEQVKGDQTKMRIIHTKQLIGIENNPKMFCLSCSNMMLRGDGKSNIHQQDCFEISEEEIKKLKPTIGFLNPPYSKDNGHKELAFIENCLSFLEPNSTCVAIVPQSSMMNTKKGNLDVKNRLLEKHTLKAVMSMPDTLFKESDKAVITCILVFEAHKPHNDTAKTWFGYWKNDGHLFVRNRGRVDYYGNYEKEIKNRWLDSYRDKREIDGFSILKHVEGEDEWLVEPYIKTKFEDLTDDDFITTLRNYCTFLYGNQLKDKVSDESLKNQRLSLDFKKWKSIKLSPELFEVIGSKTTDKKILDEEYSNNEEFPYISTQSTNNGVRAWYALSTDKGNILTIDSAWLGYCSYQSMDFTASDHVEKLIPKFDLNVYRALFLTTIINMEQYRYSYGRKYNQDRIRDTIIKLPFKDGSVDWNFIEDYIKGLPCSKHVG
jgi:hypothetical protein